MKNFMILHQQPVRVIPLVHVSMMVRRIMILALLLSCVCAAPVPVPDSAKISLIRNSTIGLALAAGRSKTAGVFEGNRNTNMNNVVKDPEEKRPDFSLLENVNSGLGLAIDGSISIGVIKDNLFSGNFKNPFGKRK